MEPKRARDIPDGDLIEEARHPEVQDGSPKQKEDERSKSSSPQQQQSNSTANLEPAKSKIGTLPTDSESFPSPSRRIGQDDQLESARAEMGEVREENERLKLYLERIMRDYKALQMQFLGIVKQDVRKQQPASSPGRAGAQELEESSLVSLSLGWDSGPSSLARDGKAKLLSAPRNNDQKIDEDHQEGLALSLDCKFEAARKSGMSSIESNLLNNTSPENSSEDRKEEAGEVWPPSKVLKTMRSGDDEVSLQNPAKKARVCVRARCDTPTMNDGCQWRKYGQKIAKGNPCPRAYYRCTVAASCPVRKQVQRCAEDMSILITTYEGTHNHPLPVSATAMASTTSAAASMLLSGSSTSGSGHGPTTAATTDLRHGLNFYLSDPSRSKQFYLPYSSPITTSTSHPTITLDLTASSPAPAVPSSASSYLNQFSLGTNYYNSLARYSNSSTSLNFSSPDPITSRPISWSNGLLNYGSATHHELFNKSNPNESLLHHLPHLQKPNNNPQDSIAAATKAITTDPNFQSALVAALKSIINAGSGTASALGNHHGGGGGDVPGSKSRWNESSTASVGSVFGQTTVPQLNACGSSYLNKSSSTPSTNSHHQPASLMFLQSNPISLPISSSKQNAAAASPADNRDRNSL